MPYSDGADSTTGSAVASAPAFGVAARVGGRFCVGGRDRACVTRRLPADVPIRAVAQVRLRLDLAYDGADFHGWAVQPGLRTVQAAVQDALHLALRTAQPPLLTVAGRTDSGVHARGQVAHVDVAEEAWTALAPRAFLRLNRLLPPDIRLYAIGVAPPGFDARFAALWRRYSYRVCDDTRLDPVRRRDTLAYGAALDLDKINQAAKACLGEHDFGAFCKKRPGATTIRRATAA